MNRQKTKQVVYGAMMLAIFALLILFDTYTGSMFNVFLYYLMPLPFVVYGLKFGFQMTVWVGVAAIILCFMLGLPETILFTVSAVLISLVLIAGILKKMNGGMLFLLVMVVTTMSQLLSVTVFAAILGYDLIAEVNEMLAWLGVHIQIDQIGDMVLALTCIIIGAMEAFIITNFCDLLLTRLKMERVPKFSLLKFHLSKLVGTICLTSIALAFLLPNQITTFLGVLSYCLLAVQGIAFVLYYVVVKQKGRILVPLAWIICLVPGINLIDVGLGLIDIYSEKRQKLLYNRANM